MCWECCVIEKQWTLTQSGHEVVLAHLNCIFLHSIPPPEVDFLISFSFLHWKSNSNNDSNVTLKNKQKNRQQQKKTTKTREQSQRHCSDGAEQPKFTSFIHPFRYWNDLILSLHDENLNLSLLSRKGSQTVTFFSSTFSLRSKWSRVAAEIQRQTGRALS